MTIKWATAIKTPAIKSVLHGFIIICFSLKSFVSTRWSSISSNKPLTTIAQCSQTVPLLQNDAHLVVMNWSGRSVETTGINLRERDIECTENLRNKADMERGRFGVTIEMKGEWRYKVSSFQNVTSNGQPPTEQMWDDEMTIVSLWGKSTNPPVNFHKDRITWKCYVREP